MPWRETSQMNERLQFMARWTQRDEENFAELCREFGISRKTGYKWVERYEKQGAAGLMERPVGRRVGVHRVELEVVRRVLEARKAHPKWGPKKLKALLESQDEELRLPVASTIGAWLKQYGQIAPRKRRIRVGGKQGDVTGAVEPNDVWALDFKGDFLTGNGQRVYPWTLTDEASRYLLKCEGCSDKGTAIVKVHCERAFMEFGLPNRLLMDNGTPWVTRTIGGLSSLLVWWVELGIVPERIEVGHPEQNGKHERMHRTLKEATCLPPQENPGEQQRAFDLFRAEFNDVRPHEALGMKPPARVYVRSYRPYPAVLREPEYDSGVEVRRPSSTGVIVWKRAGIGVGQLLAGKGVGIHQVDENVWEFRYGPLWLLQARVLGNGEVRVKNTPGADSPEKAVCRH